MAIFNSYVSLPEAKFVVFCFWPAKKGSSSKKIIQCRASRAQYDLPWPPHDISDKSSGDDGLEIPQQ